MLFKTRSIKYSFFFNAIFVLFLEREYYRETKINKNRNWTETKKKKIHTYIYIYIYIYRWSRFTNLFQSNILWIVFHLLFVQEESTGMRFVLMICLIISTNYPNVLKPMTNYIWLIWCIFIIVLCLLSTNYLWLLLKKKKKKIYPRQFSTTITHLPF